MSVRLLEERRLERKEGRVKGETYEWSGTIGGMEELLLHALLLDPSLPKGKVRLDLLARIGQGVLVVCVDEPV
jgi:hypothetical protein